MHNWLLPVPQGCDKQTSTFKHCLSLWIDHLNAFANLASSEGLSKFDIRRYLVALQ